jgi:hypothetical protein
MYCTGDSVVKMLVANKIDMVIYEFSNLCSRWRLLCVADGDTTYVQML